MVTESVSSALVVSDSFWGSRGVESARTALDVWSSQMWRAKGGGWGYLPYRECLGLLEDPAHVEDAHRERTRDGVGLGLTPRWDAALLYEAALDKYGKSHSRARPDGVEGLTVCLAERAILDVSFGWGDGTLGSSFAVEEILRELLLGLYPRSGPYERSGWDEGDLLESVRSAGFGTFRGLLPADYAGKDPGRTIERAMRRLHRRSVSALRDALR